jgi:hypothetical protein
MEEMQRYCELIAALKIRNIKEIADVIAFLKEKAS